MLPMRRTFTPLIFAGVILLAGCDVAQTARYKEDFRERREMASGSRLVVETLNGSVEIDGSGASGLEVSGTKHAESEDQVRAMRIEIQSDSGTVRIRTVLPPGARRNLGASYVIRVPSGTIVERVETSNGRVSVTDVKTVKRLRTSNASVILKGTEGEVEVATSNGSVQAEGHRGPIVATTSNGNIVAPQAEGFLEARTSNGRINARLSRPDAGRLLTLETSNGSINFQLAELRGNDVRAITSNGSIEFGLPPGAGADLRAKTSNGSIRSDFDLAGEGARSKSTLEGRIGSGGPVMRLSTSNGSIRLARL